MDLWTDVRDQYLRFAAEASDSPCFSSWSRHVADDPELLAWLGVLPQVKQQPNLVFAAARWHGVQAPGPYTGLRDALLGDDGSIVATILERSTQTNEAGRLATLVPALAEVSARADDRPLSLVEVGASAGLCLYPDRWSYVWETDEGIVRAGDGPPLACRVSGPAPLPVHVPQVAARRGIDLGPIDVRDPDATAWLANLVWPEQEERRERLVQAVAITRADPPRIEQGDLVENLPRMVGEAAADGPVVVFHSAVIAYLDPARRTAFEAVIRDLVDASACHWISNEAAGVLPSVTATGPAVPPGHPTFVLGVDGRAVAWTHGHGRSLRWHP
ncbi:DUF2332 domain-containing protein [Aeromicrobium sp. Leaf350]|uniref:DUF2332 domain-containing protein n=1 Tax=Aeromicrobium sp. Leaf350 TaxID=2876565 RepID=UPI001E58788B|nr:DUF2332 domain-containing protein [Aeromicrobium sp. Leaf350]